MATNATYTRECPECVAKGGSPIELVKVGERRRLFGLISSPQHVVLKCQTCEGMGLQKPKKVFHIANQLESEIIY